MRKLLAFAIVLLLFGFARAEASKVFLDGDLKFQTEAVNRGRREMTKSLASHLEFNIRPNAFFRAYIGDRSLFSVSGRSEPGRFLYFDKTVPYIGCTYSIKSWTIDTGYCHNFYVNIPSRDGVQADGHEIYCGLSYEILLSPSLYCFYDFRSNEFALEASIGHMFDFAKFGMSGLGLELVAKVGYDRATKPYGISVGDMSTDRKSRKGYVYYGATADLVYSLNDRSSARAGLSYSVNAAGKSDWPNSWPDEENRWINHKNNIWFDASVDCSF